MHHDAVSLDAKAMHRATERSKSRVDHILDTARKIDEDAKKSQRLAANKCKACFYQSRIGGAAITHQPCVLCGEDQSYASTSTDALCPKCASAHQLCKQCGGDIEMNTDRRTWPTE